VPTFVGVSRESFQAKNWEGRPPCGRVVLVLVVVVVLKAPV